MRRLIASCAAIAILLSLTRLAESIPRPGRPDNETGGSLSRHSAQPSHSVTRIQPDSLVHLGSFRVPQGISVGTAQLGFEYGGTALAFNPANNSLFIVGHDWDQFTAEIGIPGFNETAPVLQALTDAWEGRTVGDDSKVGGQLVYRNQLILTKYMFYDASHGQTASHATRPLDLAIRGRVNGPHKVGKLLPGFYAGYMAHVPPAWQAQLGGPVLTGNCCLSIISRTSYGPAAFVIDPANIGIKDRAIPLVYYPADHQTLGAYGAPGVHPVFSGATSVKGLVFPEGTSSVLFIGSTGIGNYCYGEAAECGDPVSPYKGEHAYPYRAYVWAYSAFDLAAVKSGVKRPWDVKPYATWELPFGNQRPGSIGGAALDPATGHIYVSQRFADGDRPLIQVFKVQ